MSDKIPFDVSDPDILNSLMTMREATRMVISFKKTHPTLFPGRDDLWAKDIEDLSKMLADYDLLIRKLLEINMKQGEMLDSLTTRLEQMKKGA